MIYALITPFCRLSRRHTATFRRLVASALASLLLLLIASEAAAQHSYSYLRQWGTAGSGNGQFNLPVAVGFDEAGNLLIADWYNHRIQRFSPTGAYIDQWGSSGTGNGQFSNPGGVGADATGNIFVVDAGNSRIQKFDSNGDFLLQWGGLATGNGKFNNPRGLALDGAGNLYVADMYNDRIQKFDLNGNFLLKWGEVGQSQGLFDDPVGVAVDPTGTYVYVADRLNHRIQKFTNIGGFLLTWGSHGAGDGQFERLSGIAVDTAGDVFVTDFDNHRVQKFSEDGTFLTSWGSLGNEDDEFNLPGGAVVSAAGEVYVADGENDRIVVYAVSIEAPVITDPNGGVDYFTNAIDPVTISGTCDSEAVEILMNDSATGVTFTAGDTSWSYTSGALSTGANVFTVRAHNGGSASPFSDAITITLDDVAPTVGLDSAVASPTNSSPIPVTVTFSEAVVDFTAEDIDPGNASIENFDGSGIAYSFDLVPSGQGAVTVDIPAAVCTDAADNPNAAALQFSREYDSVGPEIVLSSPATAPVVATIQVTATLSEDTDDFAAEDITVGNGNVEAFAGAGSVYTFTLTPTFEGPVSVEIPVGACSDSLGNASSASNKLEYETDNEPPAPSLSSALPSPTNDSPIPVTVTFNEAVSGFTEEDLVPGNATVSAFSGADANYSFELTPHDQGTVTVDIPAGVCTDAGGNPNEAAFFSHVYDSVAPVVSVNPLITDDYSPPLTGAIDDAAATIAVTVDGQTLAATNHGTTWTVDDDVLGPLAPETYDVLVEATDAAGNLGSDPGIGALVIEEQISQVAGVITASLPPHLWILGSELQLRAPEGSNYEWYFDNTRMTDSQRVSGANNRNLDISFLAFADTGIYRVRYEDASTKARFVSLPFSLAVLERSSSNRKITASLPPEFRLAGVPLTLTAPEGSSHEWFRNDALLDDAPPQRHGVNGRHLRLDPLLLEDTAIYSVSYNDGTGIVTSLPFALTVLANEDGERISASGPVMLGALLVAIALAAALVLWRPKRRT